MTPWCLPFLGAPVAYRLENRVWYTVQYPWPAGRMWVGLVTENSLPPEQLKCCWARQPTPPQLLHKRRMLAGCFLLGRVSVCPHCVCMFSTYRWIKCRENNSPCGKYFNFKDVIDIRHEIMSNIYMLTNLKTNSVWSSSQCNNTWISLEQNKLLFSISL